jgi:ADP-ribose pyrophosphatase YjhB (NUDIX family)
VTRNRCYVESDGRLYLVRRGDVVDLPFPDELPFPYEAIAPLATTPPATFCVPLLERHPADWPLKDDVVADPQACPLVRAAIQASMPRVVVEAICPGADDHVLLVKGSRGYTAGRWALPGGFVRFGERPEDGIARELREELGVVGRVGRLLTVRGRVGRCSHLHWLMLFYRVAIDGPLCVDPDEIAEARWCPRETVAEMVQDEVLSDAIMEALSRIA